MVLNCCIHLTNLQILGVLIPMNMLHFCILLIQNTSAIKLMREVQWKVHILCSHSQKWIRLAFYGVGMTNLPVGYAIFLS